MLEEIRNGLSKLIRLSILLIGAVLGIIVIELYIIVDMSKGWNRESLVHLLVYFKWIIVLKHPLGRSFILQTGITEWYVLALILLQFLISVVSAKQRISTHWVTRSLRDNRMHWCITGELHFYWFFALILRFLFVRRFTPSLSYMAARRRAGDSSYFT